MKYLGLDLVASTSYTAGAAVKGSEMVAKNYRDNEAAYNNSHLSNVEFKAHSESNFSKGYKDIENIGKPTTDTKASNLGVNVG